MIYSDAFDGLPAVAREAIYRRMYAVLAGQDQAPRYARQTPADRRAIIEFQLDGSISGGKRIPSLEASVSPGWLRSASTIATR